jgi:P-type E1-E2 ATPase
VYLAWEGKLRGRLLLADAVRRDAGDCIGALFDRGISSVILSGDRFPAAASIAGRVGISRVEAPRNPAQKLQAIADSIAAGKVVAMVGDGINDAPALAAAHTGIAFGAGMDLARQAGNVVILSGRLMQVPWLIALSRRTGSIIRGNFAWSFGYNAIALGAAAAGLLHPLLAALAMVFSSLTVLGNSLRITRFPGHADLRQEKESRRAIV